MKRLSNHIGPVEIFLCDALGDYHGPCFTQRICRVIGGGSFSRSSHFGAAFEDVRALGFLRPPWALAYDQLLQRTWASYEAPKG